MIGDLDDTLPYNAEDVPTPDPTPTKALSFEDSETKRAKYQSKPKDLSSTLLLPNTSSSATGDKIPDQSLDDQESEDAEDGMVEDEGASKVLQPGTSGNHLMGMKID